LLIPSSRSTENSRMAQAAIQVHPAVGGLLLLLAAIFPLIAFEHESRSTARREQDSSRIPVL
ncbi:MAG TPA: hypothetical protein VIY86_06945, partial [Pirellulaceae bacterium]